MRKRYADLPLHTQNIVYFRYYAINELWYSYIPTNRDKAYRLLEAATRLKFWIDGDPLDHPIRARRKLNGEYVTNA